MDMTGGNIAIGFSALPERSLKDTSGGLKSRSMNIHLSLPLFGNRGKVSAHSSKDGHPHFFQVSAHGSFTSGSKDIEFLDGQSNFYGGSAGLSGLFYNGKSNIIQADANMGISADGQSLQNHDVIPRFSGSFIVQHTSSPTLSFQYGAAFTYLYGRPMLLPVLGIRKKFSGSSWSVSAILPLSLQFTDRLNNKMGLSFFARPSGDRFQILNQGYFGSTTSSIYMGLRQFEVGSSFYYRLSREFSFDAEAGLLSGGRMKFTNASDTRTTLYETGVKSGSQFRISLRYHLPHKRATGNNIDIDGELYRVN